MQTTDQLDDLFSQGKYKEAEIGLELGTESHFCVMGCWPRNQKISVVDMGGKWKAGI